MSNLSPINVSIYGFNDVIDTKQLKKLDLEAKPKKTRVKKVKTKSIEPNITKLNESTVTNSNELTKPKKCKVKKTRVKCKTDTKPNESTETKLDNITDSNETKKTKVKKIKVKSKSKTETKPIEPVDLNQIHRTETKPIELTETRSDDIIKPTKPKKTRAKHKQIESLEINVKPIESTVITSDNIINSNELTETELTKPKKRRVKTDSNQIHRTKVKTVKLTKSDNVTESNESTELTETKPIELTVITLDNITETKLDDVNESKPKKTRVKKTRTKHKQTKSTNINVKSNESVEPKTKTVELTNVNESDNLIKPTELTETKPIEINVKPNEINVKSNELIEPTETTKPNTFNVSIDVSNVRCIRCSLCNSVIQDNPVRATKFTGDTILIPHNLTNESNSDKSNHYNTLTFCDLLCARLYDTNVIHISIDFNDYRMSYIKRQLSKKARSIYEKCADKLLTQLIICKFSVDINKLSDVDRINYIDTLKNDLISKL